MKLKESNFNHEEENFNKAIGIPADLIVLCRERIFFTHFAHSLQADELFPNRDDAPKEYKTVTGDLQATLNMISDPLEYDFTLLNFMPYHRVAQEAYSRYSHSKDIDDDDSMSKEERIKHELVKLVTKLHALKESMHEDEEDEDDDDYEDNSLSLKSVINRIKLVKETKYNFHKYMTAMGHPITRNYNDVDDLLNDLFK
jgi:hypothetical protein